MEERKNKFILFGEDDAPLDNTTTAENQQLNEKQESFQGETSTAEVKPFSFDEFKLNDTIPVKEVNIETPNVTINTNNVNTPDVSIDIPLMESTDNSSNQIEEQSNVIANNNEDTATSEVTEIEPSIPVEDTLKVEPIAENIDNTINQPQFEEEPDEEIIEEEDSKQNFFEASKNLQNMINSILKIDELEPVRVNVELPKTKEQLEQERLEAIHLEEMNKENMFREELNQMLNEKVEDASFMSDVLDKLREEEAKTNTFSMLTRYGEDYTSKTFVTNPSIGREEELKQLILTLLTPEKSAILTGKPGIGKTSIVEGLAYRLERNLVPDALKGFSIINIKTASLMGTLPTGETRLQTLVNELKSLSKVILFIDEIHMLIGATSDSAMDFANMFKEGLGRGQIKIIGATTTEEYERYVLRDKAFVRRFQRIEIVEPNRELTIKILMGTLPKIEKETGAKLKYTSFVQSEIMGFIVDITSEYKRIYGIGSRYPDICLTLLKEAFSQCIFDNRKEVNISDIRNAIQNSKNIYPDVIRKELPKFDEKFSKMVEDKEMGN